MQLSSARSRAMKEGIWGEGVYIGAFEGLGYAVTPLT